MTMLSFRVDDTQAAAVQLWADRLGMDRSELLREALRQQLVRLAGERDATAWEEQPASAEELSVGASAHWGPAEDWSDWGTAVGHDAAR